MGRGSCKPRLSAAEAAEAEAASYRPSQQAKEARMAELEERARLFGDSVKQSAQAQVLERKWLIRVGTQRDGHRSPLLRHTWRWAP